MDNIWNSFKKTTLEMQHLFNNMLIQSYNQCNFDFDSNLTFQHHLATLPRENQIYNEMEEQQVQHAMSLSLGQNEVANRRYNDPILDNIFPAPLPDNPNEFLRNQNMMMEDEITPQDEDEEEMLNIAMRESLKEAKEKGIKVEENTMNDEHPSINTNNNNNINNLINFEDPIERTILEIREQRRNANERKRLLKEQEQAYQETLLMDNQKKLEEERKLKEQKQLELEMQQKKEMEEAIQLSKELSKKNKLEKIISNIPLEPSKSEKDIVELVVRLTDGTKVSRRFKQDNTLLQLHNWITSLSSEKNIPDLFSISLSYPRKKFSDLNITFKEANLIGSVLLFIEEEEENDDN